MSTVTDVPAQGWGRIRQIGPGIVAAATGVGIGDLAVSLVTGARYGTLLLWAVVIGAILKYAMAEGVGRWHLATGTTITRGWRELGNWTLIYFGVYIVIWGFSYGGAVMSATALPLKTLFPAVPFNLWAVLSALAGFVLVLVGHYRLLEKVTMALVGLMFVTVVGTAVLVLPDIPEVVAGLVPRIPDGSVAPVLAMVGGVGGTITLAAYGMWIRAKGWRTSEWLAVMRIDATTAYVLTGVFMIAMLIVGANMLHAAGLDIEGQQGLTAFGEQLREQFGGWARVLFLLGFWATSFTSLLGVWNGVSMFFADFVETVREQRAGAAGGGTVATSSGGVEGEREQDGAERPEVDLERTPAFKVYLLWLTFPPMLLLFLAQPIALVVTYAILGAFFMPFLAATLLLLLNSRRRVPDGYRNGWLSNGTLAVGLLLFAFLLLQELVGQFG